MLIKIKRRIISVYSDICKFIFNVGFRIKFLFPPKYGLYEGKKRNERIIISLTSFPDRMGAIYLCIRSLLCQKMKPDKIILYLSQEQFKNISIPDNINNLKRYGLEIQFCKDLKPHKKYFYSMQQYPNDVIITVDDDVFYRSTLVRDLVKEHIKRKENIICTRAHKIRFDNGKILPYRKWDYETKDRSRSSHYLLATGVGGVLYPANSLPKYTFNEEEIIRLCLLADDIWLKAVEIKANIKVFALPSTKIKYVVGIWNSEKVTLSNLNVENNKNDDFLNVVFTHFNIKESDFQK